MTDDGGMDRGYLDDCVSISLSPETLRFFGNLTQRKSAPWRSLRTESRATRESEVESEVISVSIYGISHFGNFPEAVSKQGISSGMTVRYLQVEPSSFRDFCRGR